MKNQLILLLELSIHLCLFAGNENFPAGARSSSLASASVSLHDIWSSFNNQAGLAWLSQPSAAFYYENRFLVSSYAVQAGTLAAPLNPGTLCLSYQYFGYSAYHELKSGLAFARRFHKNVAAGIQINYHQTYIAGEYETARALTIEAGLMYTPTEDLFIGFHVFNPNRSRSGTLPKEHIPSVIRAGASYNIFGKATVLFETGKNLNSPPVFKCGVEIYALKSFDLRFGMGSGNINYTFGFGYHFLRWHFDLAFSHHNILGYSPQASLTFNLKKNHE